MKQRQNESSDEKERESVLIISSLKVGKQREACRSEG